MEDWLNDNYKAGGPSATLQKSFRLYSFRIPTL